jgi:hypothetical protein
MSWTIHTGPFPIVAPGYDGSIWLWRLTNTAHFTAVVIKFARAVVEAEADSLSPDVALARSSRGRSAIQETLAWHEPPREIEFAEPSGGPTLWSGVPR